MSAHPGTDSPTVTERTPAVTTDTDTAVTTDADTAGYVLTHVRTKRHGSNPFAVFAFLAVLLAAALGGWAVVIGIGWLVWVYTLATLSLIASCAVTALCVWLALRGNWRARVISAAIIAALVAFVVWTVAR